jgi:hypothetical protein
MTDLTISEAELTKIDNAFVTIRENLDEASVNTPEGKKVMEMIIEAEQIIAAKLDKQGTETTESGSGYAPTPTAH